MTEMVKLQTGTVQVNEASLYYELAGTGEPLVLIHAGITDHRLWAEQVQPLARHYRVLSYNMRGYGRSTRGSGAYSQVEDLYGLLQALGIDRAILAGCSQGGTAALDFVLDYPRMASGLILISTVPTGYPLEGEPPPKLLEFMAAYQQRDLDRAAELAAQVWFDGPQRRPDQVKADLREQVRAMMRDVIAAGALDLTGATLSNRPVMDRLAEVRVPTLVVVVDQDDPTIRQAGDYLAMQIPGAEKVVIPGAAHLPGLEKPDLFNQAVLEFLTRAVVRPG